MKKTSLVLGGGGARGLAHIGVLKALEKEKIRFDMIVGTSMGSIIGAAYAVNPDAGQVEALIRSALKCSAFASMKLNLFTEKPEDQKNIFEKAGDFIKYGYIHIAEHTKYSLLDIEKLNQIINDILPDIDMSQTKIPFYCVATDLTNSAEKVFSKGSLRKAVLASSSIPGVFPPILIDGVFYCDGGSVNVTPVSAARGLGAKVILAVDVKSQVMKWEKPEIAKEIVSRSNYVTGVILNNIALSDADIIIRPAVKQLHWSDFDKTDMIIKEGEIATAAMSPRIKARLNPLSLIERIKSIFKA
jgi:NTE family protein